MIPRAPSSPKTSTPTHSCRCGMAMPKSSYLCTDCWNDLNVVQQMDLKQIRRAIQNRAFNRLQNLARG